MNESLTSDMLMSSRSTTEISNSEKRESNLHLCQLLDEPKQAWIRPQEWSVPGVSQQLVRSTTH